MSHFEDNNKKGIYVKLREDFDKAIDLAWRTDFDESPENVNAKKEVERHVYIWNQMAEFMGYGMLIAPNLLRFIPIYFNHKFPSGKSTVETNEGMFCPVSEYNPIEDHIITEYMRRHRINEWCPTLNFNDAKECEANLLKAGKYNSVSANYYYSTLGARGAEFVGMNIVTINYSSSLYNRDLTGQGANELEAICDACMKFMVVENKIKNTKLKEIC